MIAPYVDALHRDGVILTALGCVKINLQIIGGNDRVATFYRTLGYAVEERISMGKRIPQNITGL